MLSITLLLQVPQTIPVRYVLGFVREIIVVHISLRSLHRVQYVRLLLFYSVIFQSCKFQSCKFSYPSCGGIIIQSFSCQCFSHSYSRLRSSVTCSPQILKFLRLWVRGRIDAHTSRLCAVHKNDATVGLADRRRMHYAATDTILASPSEQIRLSLHCTPWSRIVDSPNSPAHSRLSYIKHPADCFCERQDMLSF